MYNETYTYTTTSLRTGKEIEQPVTNTYNEHAYMPVALDKDGNLCEIPVADEELRRLFRTVFEMCVHGQYKLFDKMLTANSERIDKTFVGIANEKKHINAKAEVLRRLPFTFTREDVRHLYCEYFQSLNDGTVRNWISDWRKANQITENENNTYTKI